MNYGLAKPCASAPLPPSPLWLTLVMHQETHSAFRRQLFAFAHGKSPIFAGIIKI
jgi:hypothetical protein